MTHDSNRPSLWTKPGTPPRGTSRRQFLTAGLSLGTVLGGLPSSLLAAAGNPHSAILASVLRLESPDARLPWYLADHNGNGMVDPQDQHIIQSALGSSRGFKLEPATGYDHRADIFGRGRVDQRDLDASNTLAGVAAEEPSRLPPRPAIVAWHYGWYQALGRSKRRQTVGFLGGDYLSSDPRIEGSFNKLKNEFGISVDALSWISPRKNRRIWQNFELGYLRAPLAETRHAALLYESTLNLPTTGSNRIDFVAQNVRGCLVDDFRNMGLAFARIRDGSPVRLFELHMRPVIFIYGSHTWGERHSASYEYGAMDEAIEDARAAFAEEFGRPPFLIGEELLLASRDAFSSDRARRSANFDGVFAYHHAASTDDVANSDGILDEAYIQRQERLLKRSLVAVSEIENRFSSRQLLVVPSLAAGFAKRGFQKLLVTRESYATLMQRISALHMRLHVEKMWDDVAIGRKLQPAIYSVGSWNEEYEGHAVFPARFNRSVSIMRKRGFDQSLAIKQVFGWNHYMQRDF